MKTFYTERDIEDMHAQGITKIEIDDDVILTDLAMDKAISLGIKLKRVAERSAPPPADGMPRLALAPNLPFSSPPASTPPAPAPADDLTATIKAAVIARLGTHQYDDLLDAIIPIVLKRMKNEA